MTDFGKEISSVVSSLSKGDLEGALPYLLLTSKSESIVRDLLAARLHEKFQGKHYAVAREWSYKKKQTKPRGRVDIAILASSGRGKNRIFIEPPPAILEAKMVAAPGKDNKNIHKHLKDLQCQLRERKDRWRNTECFGLFMVRDFRETSPNSTSAFNGKVIKSKRESLRSNPNFDQSVDDRAMKLNLRRVNQKCLVCGEDKIFKARVYLKLWLFSLQ